MAFSAIGCGAETETIESTNFVMDASYSLMNDKEMMCVKVSNGVFECYNDDETCLIQDKGMYCSPNEDYFRVFEGERL